MTLVATEWLNGLLELYQSSFQTFLMHHFRLGPSWTLIMYKRPELLGLP